MKSFQRILGLFIILNISVAESSIGDDNWDGLTDWSEIPKDIFVGPGVGNARGTDFCDVVRNKPHDLKNALVGRNLSVAVQYGPGFDFFVYNQEEELSATNPSGMIANVLDELASRAGFSWRNSFVAYNTTTTDILVGKGAGKWDRMLKQLTSRFDLSVDKWYLTSERLENQTVFLRSWFDSSLILVDQGNELKINWFGFKEPFQDSVWTGIIATILMSAIFMIIIESLEDRRDGRTLKSWFSDHLYLTFLAFTQQFVFLNPRSAAGRVFLASFSFWAMLIGATYTANLASLLVESALSSPVNSIESAMNGKLSICIHEGSASQTIMETLYPQLKDYLWLVKTPNPIGMYERLTRGECDILIGTRQEFEIYGNQKEYGCNLVETGGELHSGTASFAIEFDPLNCDSVLAYVLNLHLYGMSLEGIMTKFWSGYLNNRDDNCEIVSGRRLVESDGDNSMESRQLKGGAAASSNSGGFSEESNTDSLGITGMAGVFLVHGVGTGIAILIAVYSHLRKCNMLKMDRQERIFGVHSDRIAKTELEQKYDALKADMMAQMDQFFAEHRESGQRHSHVQMRTIIDARQSMANLARGSVAVAPRTPTDIKQSIWLSSSDRSSLNSSLRLGVLEASAPPKVGTSDLHESTINNPGEFESFRLGALEESALPDSIDEGVTQSS